MLIYKQKNKNSIFYFLFSIFSFAILFSIFYFLFSQPVSAQSPSNPVSRFFDSRYAPPITRLGQVADYGGGSLLVRLTNWLIAIFWIVAVGFVIWAAFQFLFAAGDETKFGEAKSKIYYALIAAVIALLATGIKPITMSLLRGETGGGGGGGGDETGETTLTLNGKDCLDPFGNDEPIEISDKMVNLSLYDSAAERQLRDNPNDPIDTTISTTVSVDSRDKIVQYPEARNITVNICSPNENDAICYDGTYKLYVQIKYTIGESRSLECEIEYRK